LTHGIDFKIKVNGDDPIESFLRKWEPNKKKLDDQTKISRQIKGQKKVI